MHQKQPKNVVQRFFAGITEYAFQSRLGVVDPPLTDYITDMLVRFLRTDSVYKVRNLSGRRLLEVVEMMTEAKERAGEARREAHRHIGDFTLFWTGLYPEALEKNSQSPSPDQLVDYCEQGKRAYFIASTIESGRNEDSTADVLGRLSQQFELCAYGLGEVRREWERRDDGTMGAPTFLIN